MPASDKSAPKALLLLVASARSDFFPPFSAGPLGQLIRVPKSPENAEFQGKAQGTVFSWPGLSAYRVSLAIPTTCH